MGAIQTSESLDDILPPDMSVEDLGHRDQGGVVNGWPTSPRPSPSEDMLCVGMNPFARIQCLMFKKSCK